MNWAPVFKSHLYRAAEGVVDAIKHVAATCLSESKPHSTDDLFKQLHGFEKQFWGEMPENTMEICEMWLGHVSEEYHDPEASESDLISYIYKRFITRLSFHPNLLCKTSTLAIDPDGNKLIELFVQVCENAIYSSVDYRIAGFMDSDEEDESEAKVQNVEPSFGSSYSSLSGPSSGTSLPPFTSRPLGPFAPGFPTHSASTTMSAPNMPSNMPPMGSTQSNASSLPPLGPLPIPSPPMFSNPSNPPANPIPQQPPKPVRVTLSKSSEPVVKARGRQRKEKESDSE